MATPTPRELADKVAEEARQRAAGRQRDIKKTNDPSNIARGSTQVRAYKDATKANWSRAAQEARLTGAARAYEIAQKKAKRGK